MEKNGQKEDCVVRTVQLIWNRISGPVAPSLGVQSKESSLFKLHRSLRNKSQRLETPAAWIHGKEENKHGSINL